MSKNLLRGLANTGTGARNLFRSTPPYNELRSSTMTAHSLSAAGVFARLDAPCHPAGVCDLLRNEFRAPKAVLRASLWPCLLLCCGLSSFMLAEESDPVVGSIGEIELHQSEVMATFGTLGSVEREALARDSATLNKLVRSMLVQRVILKEAVEKKWEAEPATQALLKSTREAAIADSYLKALNRPPESYPSEAELKAAYENGRAALTVPRSFRLAQIFIAEEKGSDKKLKVVQQRLKEKPGSFAEVARELSEEKESASRDGEIGWLREQQIQPEILAQLPQLKVNAISAPVRLKDGWHILKVLDVREPFTPIFDQVRVQLAQRMRNEKSSASMQAYVSEVLQKHPVAINEVALSKLLQNAPSNDAGVKP